VAVLVLVRHAPTSETGKRLTGRLPGVALDDRGRRRAADVSFALAGREIDAVYTSPVLRCRETARAVAEPHDLDPIPYRSLIEVDYGEWSGRTLGSLRRTKAWRQVVEAPSRVQFPGGERLLDVQARAVAAAEELSAAHGSKTIVLVTHGDVIKAMLAHYLGMHLDLFQRIHVAPASISAVDLPVIGSPYVLTVNTEPPERSS